MLMIIKGHLVELCLTARDWLLLLSVIPETATGILRTLGPGFQMSEGPQGCEGSKELRAGRGPLRLSRCIEQVGSLGGENLHREPPGPGSSFPPPEYDTVIFAFGIGEEERLI